MTGVGEAGLALGLISSVITIFEAAHEIYEAASDTQGLPKKFRVAAEQIPLVYHALSLAEQNIRAQKVNEQALRSAKPVLEVCKDSATRVKDIFDKTIPAPNASRADRLKKAVGLRLKSNKVKEDMERVVKNMALLAQHQVFQDAAALEDIKAAVEQLGSLPDQEDQPQFMHSGAGAINANTGSGQQYNYSTSGSGHQYNAAQQYFGRDQVENQTNVTYHYNVQEDQTVLALRNKFAGVYAYSSLCPTTTYVSRPELEQRMRDQLSISENAQQGIEPRTIVVCGLGGAGKSQLVLRYVQQHQQHYQAVFWIQAEQRNTIERDFVQIYRQLYPRAATAGTAASSEDAINAVKSWLQTQERRCLWVMDSADDVEDDTSELYIDLNHYLPAAPLLDRIVTTRSSQLSGLSQQGAIEVKEMTEAEAIDLFWLCANLTLKREEHEQELSTIVKELGYLALVVTLAGSYVHEDPEMSMNLSLYLVEFEQRRAQFLDQKPHRIVHQYERSVLSTWEISFSRIARIHPMAAKLLNILGCLHFDDLFLELFVNKPPSPINAEYETITQLTESLNNSNQPIPDNGHITLPQKSRWVEILSNTGAPADHRSIKSAFKTLHAYSFVSWRIDQQAYRMHKLVHAWSYERLSIKQRRLWCSAVLELLSIMVRDHRGDLVMERRLVPHAMASFITVSALTRRDHQMTRNEYHSLENIGFLLQRLGRWNDEHDVRVFLQRVTETTLGAEHPDTLASMNTVAKVLIQQGKYEQAEHLFRQTLELREKVLGLEHPDTLKSMNSLGKILRVRGKYELAQQMLQKTVELQKRLLGCEHLDTQTTLKNSALVLSDQGEHEQAEQIYRQTLESWEKVLGPKHPNTIKCMNDLAGSLHMQGKLEEAEQIYQQPVKLHKEVFGHEHPYTLIYLHNLALTVLRRGRLNEGEETFQTIFNLQKKILGVEHPNTLSSIENLAWIKAEQGEHEQAEQTYRYILELRRKVLGHEHPDTLLIMHNLALTIGVQGDYKQAEQLCRETLNLQQKVLGHEHPDTQLTTRNLAWAIAKQEDIRQASRAVVLTDTQPTTECTRSRPSSHAEKLE